MENGDDIITAGDGIATSMVILVALKLPRMVGGGTITNEVFTRWKRHDHNWAGNDSIWGGYGDDIINAGDGDNTVYGGDGKRIP